MSSKSKSEEQKMAKLVKKLAGNAANKKPAERKRYDTTLPPETSDDDLERREFFKEMKKREF